MLSLTIQWFCLKGFLKLISQVMLAENQHTLNNSKMTINQSWRDLRVGDRICILQFPQIQMLENTKQLYQRLIAERAILRIWELLYVLSITFAFIKFVNFELYNY